MAVNLAVPRWRTLLTKALEEYPRSTVIQLATIDAGGPIPRVRSHIFRSFWEGPKAPHLPLLLTSTDVRTPKIDQTLKNPNVEVAWHIADRQEQFRITGRVSLITSPDHKLYRITREQLLNNAHVDSEGGLASWTDMDFNWEAKRVEVFKAMSPQMKASWCRPTPGSPLEGGEAEKWPETVEEPEGDSGEARRNWETALGNFALVVIEPSEVDYVALAVNPNRRFKFARAVEGGWDEVEVVP